MAWHDAAPFLPHQGRMRLIDLVGADGRASAMIRADNPFLAGAGLPAWVGIEYMAQAVAACHNLGLGRAGPARPGVITAIKDWRCARDYLDPAVPLTVHTELVHAERGHAVSQCRLWQGVEIASATLYTKEHDEQG